MTAVVEEPRRRSLLKPMLLMLLAVVAVLAVVGGIKWYQMRGAMAGGGGFRPPPEAVTTIVARAEAWPATIRAIGTVRAVQGVVVSADLPGVVADIGFDSGSRVRSGAVLVRLDASQERAQLAAAEAERELAAANLRRLEQLRQQGIVAPADHDRATAAARQSEAAVGEIRATIERKTIRAPFGGVLGIRQVNLGQYLAPGAAIVPLQTLDPVYVDFSVPQQQLAGLGLGAEVRVSAERLPAPRTGRVTALDSVIDPATRNGRVQATLDNADGQLRPGMFVDVEVVLGAGSTVIAVPATAINYAPFGDSVFVVTQLAGPDGKPYRGVKQQFVKLAGGRGDQVAVVSGLQAGDEVVTSGVFKLRNGAEVVVNNEIQPANDPAASPEEG